MGTTTLWDDEVDFPDDFGLDILPDPMDMCPLDELWFEIGDLEPSSESREIDLRPRY